MLFSLHIENVAVIHKLDIELGVGFNVLTGETGAGKSILIDSVNLLLGGKFQKELVRTGEDKAVVSGLFRNIPDKLVQQLEDSGIILEDGEILLQRIIQANGKQQSRINGQSIPVSMLKEVGRLLLNIHGQNDNQALMQSQAHVQFLDAYAHNEEQKVKYDESFAEYKTIVKKIEELSHDESETLRMREMLSYQIKDIDSVGPKEGEEEDLIAERDKLSNIEKIQKHSDLVYRMLYGSEKGSALILLEKSTQLLRQLASMVPEVDSVCSQLEDMHYSLTDIAEWVKGLGETEYEDPTTRIDEIEARLDAISKLKRKYGPEIKDIIDFKKKAIDKMSHLENSDDLLIELKEKLGKTETEMKRFASILTQTRLNAAVGLTNAVQTSLQFLDMPKVRFQVEVKPVSATVTGMDNVEFLIATNPGEPLMPLTHIASGGELSRIMLALRSVLNNRDGVGTTIYDEVDTGISGKTSRKVGIKLRQIAENTQVICVTHSAQIASLANCHYLIEKREVDGRSETQVCELDENGRVNEVARILGGLSITESQKTVASEMIQEGKQLEYGQN